MFRLGDRGDCEHSDFRPRLLTEELRGQSLFRGPLPEGFVRVGHAAAHDPVFLHHFLERKRLQPIGHHAFLADFQIAHAEAVFILVSGIQFVGELLGRLGRDVFIIPDRPKLELGDRLLGPAETEPSLLRQAVVLVDQIAPDVEGRPSALKDDLEGRR